MRVRRYQDGGRVNELLRMLEQQEVQKEAQRRMPPPMPMATEPAAASSTGVSMQRPVYTSAADAMLDQSRAGMQTFFGQDYQEFDPAAGQGVKMTAPVVEALSPVGDVAAMAEAENLPQLGLAAGMAFLPGNMQMLKDWMDWNVSPANMKVMNELVDKLNAPKSAQQVAADNAALLRMPQWRRDELAFDLEDMYGEYAMHVDPGELDKLQEMANILRSGKIPQAKPDIPDIGDFMGEADPANGLVVRYESSKNPMEYMDVVESKPNSNKYVVNIVAPKTSPMTRGKLMMAGLEKVPVGGRVDFIGDSYGLANNMSADAYPIMFRFFKRGKAEPVLDEVKYGRLNSLGENPDLFASTFGIDKTDAAKIGRSVPIDNETLSRVVPRINSKLAQYGIPPVKVVNQTKQGASLEFPYFDILRTAEGFKNGGSLRVLKMRGGGNFRVKKNFRNNA